MLYSFWSQFWLHSRVIEYSNQSHKKISAMAGNWTRINCLEGSYADHYTTNASHVKLTSFLQHKNKTNVESHVYIINCKVAPMVLINQQCSRQFVDHVVENRFGNNLSKAWWKINSPTICRILILFSSFYSHSVLLNRPSEPLTIVMNRWERVNVCVCERERERVPLWVWVRKWGRVCQIESVCACLSLSEWECECICAWVR